MSMVGKTVYTVNAETNNVDRWICESVFTGTRQKHKEKLCILRNGKKSCILPKRCVFLMESEALKVSKR